MMLSIALQAGAPTGLSATDAWDMPLPVINEYGVEACEKPITLNQDSPQTN
jgi:hypothetical protein